MMWFEELAREIKEKKKARPVRFFVSTMVTPSGPIHLGNLKEVMIGHLVATALKKAGCEVSFNFFADNYDHLRRCYPFLPTSYQKYVGISLSEIPDPEGCHKSYDQHFLQPFFKALSILGVRPQIRYMDQLYKSGVYAPLIKKALESREQIAQIISRISGRILPKDWSPFMPRCRRCQRISTTTVKEVDFQHNTVFYQCQCGDKGESNFAKGEGKLVWRVHWPAGWKIFGVDVEGFGKDLGTRGGAYDTAKVIVKEIFQGEPPFPIPYEWVYLKGQGKMAGSTGVGLTPLEVLEVLPPQILTYFYQRTRPNRHHEFDLQKTVLELWDEFGGLSRIPVRHLLMTIQSHHSFDSILDSLKRTGYEQVVKEKEEQIKEEIPYLRKWLEKYAPNELRFQVQKRLPQVQLTDNQKKLLSNFLKTVVEKKMTSGEEMHQALHSLKEQLQIPPQEAFSAIYRIFLGQDHGPQAGWFLAGLDRRFLVRRLQEAVEKL